MVNDDRVITSLSYNFGDEITSASNTAIIHLNEFDVVYVQSSEDYAAKIYSFPDFGVSTFSGYKIN